jgi:hypothetical protein
MYDERPLGAPFHNDEPMRLIEIDPSTLLPKRKHRYTKPASVALDLTETQHVAALLSACFRVRIEQDALYAEALRLAVYADRLSRRIRLEILPDDGQDIGSTSHQAGLLGELEARRASINSVAKGAFRCVIARCYTEALARLVALDCGKGA